MKYGVPVISLEFIDSCIKDAQLLDPGPFLLSETLESKQFSSGKISCKYAMMEVDHKSVL